jgi:hypothetical protein
MLSGLFGASGAYWAPDAESATVDGINIRVRETPPLFERDGMDEESERNAEIHVAIADVPVVVRLAKFVVGSDTWVVTAQPFQRNGWWISQTAFSTRVTVGKNKGDN